MSITKVKGVKDADGRQKYRVRVSYKTPDGKYKQKERTAFGRDEAKIIEMQIIASLKNADNVSKITLNDLIAEYIKSKHGEIKETSINDIKKYLRLYITPVLGNHTLASLDTRTLQNWKNGINERTLALNTKKNIYKTFRAVLNYGVKMQYLKANPLLVVGNFKQSKKQEKKEMLFYTPEEFKAYINVALEIAQKSSRLIDWDYYVFFMLAFYSGMRKGEIHALKWSDIWDNTIHLRRSVSQKLKGGDRETDPKNDSSIRDIQIPVPLSAALREHKERWSKTDGFNDDFRVCGGTRPLRDTTVDYRNRKYAKLAGVKRIRIHDFRHSHASLLANHKINIQEIARRLGHSDIEMTWNTYSHLYPQEEERALSVLNTIT